MCQDHHAVMVFNLWQYFAKENF